MRDCEWSDRLPAEYFLDQCGDVGQGHGGVAIDEFRKTTIEDLI
jgi:hypothetical protein